VKVNDTSPNYAGDINRRITVQADLGKNRRKYLKPAKVKRAGGSSGRVPA
jgi:hypothetical protein